MTGCCDMLWPWVGPWSVSEVLLSWTGEMKTRRGTKCCRICRAENYRRIFSDFQRYYRIVRVIF